MPRIDRPTAAKSNATLSQTGPSLQERLAAIRVEAAQVLKPPVKGNPLDALFDKQLHAARRLEAPCYGGGPSQGSESLRSALKTPRLSGTKQSAHEAHRIFCESTCVAYGDTETPLRLTHLGPTAERSCFEQINGAGWTEEARLAAISQFGDEMTKKVWILGMVGTLVLRRQMLSASEPDGLAKAAQLARVFRLQDAHRHRDLLSQHAALTQDSYAGTLMAHAARQLDAVALRQLCKSSPMHRERTPLACPGHLNAFSPLAWAEACVQSPHWQQDPAAGVATLEVILREQDRVVQRQMPQMAPALRDGFMRVLIHGRRVEAMAIVAEHEAPLRATTPATPTPYLRWAIEAGWAEGVHDLIDRGFDVNGRSPGMNVGHPVFAVGATPLMLVLAEESLSDAVSVQLAVKLVQRGAFLHAAAHPEQRAGLSLAELLPVELYVRRAGMARRHGLVLSQSPGVVAAQTKAVADALRAQTCRLVPLAHTILQHPEQTNSLIDTVMGALHAMQKCFYNNHLLSVSQAAELRAFVLASGRLFGDQYLPAQRGHFAGADEAPALPVEFYGATHLPVPSTLTARATAWATAFIAWVKSPGLAAGTAASSLRDTIAAPTQREEPSAWLAELARALKGDCFVSLDLAPAFQVLRGQTDKAIAVLAADPNPSPKKLALTFWLAIDGAISAPNVAQRAALTALGHAIVARCDRAPSARALLEVALRMGSVTWIGHLLEHVSAHRMDLRDIDQLGQQTLLHIGAESPKNALKALYDGIHSAWRIAWLKRADEACETPMHRAARIGVGALKVLLRGLDAQQERELLATVNASGQTPALVALQYNQLQAFAAASQAGLGLGAGEALADALTSRRGTITCELLSSLLHNDATAALLRAQAQKMAERLVRVGDVQSFSALYAKLRTFMLGQSYKSSTVLHAVAQSDEPQFLKLLAAQASKGQLRALADHNDRHGNKPEAYARSAEMRDALLALRGVGQAIVCQASEAAENVVASAIDVPQFRLSDPRPGPGLPPSRWRALHDLAQQVGQHSSGDVLERQVKAFLVAAQAEVETATDAAAQRQVQQLAWLVIDHIDRAPLSIAARMGLHLRMHRPDVPLDALLRRAKTTLSGATRFGASGGLALLQGRSMALREAKNLALRPGMHAVFHTPCAGLAGDGYVNRTGDCVRLSGSDTLRTVFAQTHQGLLLVTAYPVWPSTD